MVLNILTGLLAAGVAALGVASTSKAQPPPQDAKSSCRVLPGDANWPKMSDWQGLNDTVGGHLIETIPMGSVCHDAPYGRYDAKACADLQESWNKPKQAHIHVPGEFMSMTFKNYSCDPFTARSEPCDLGNHASYVIDVQGAEDIQAALEFVDKHNLRLTVLNTGHDYLGRSTGKGALSLWTHRLKSTEYIPAYKSSHYNGPAIKLGAGVQGFEAYTAANATGHRIVGGACPTVGLAGGYSQGGGHSMLSSRHGLGSDNVLAWEVVTVGGEHVTATPDGPYADLFWALSGGGPGNYAIVLSMTARLHRDSFIAGGTLTFDDTKVGNAEFWEAVGAFNSHLNDFSDAGNSFTYGLTINQFIAWGITMPGAEPDEAAALMKPFLDELSVRGIDYIYQPRVSADFLEHFTHALGPLPEGIFHYATFTSSRLIPRSVLETPRGNGRVTAALRSIAQAEGYVIACQTLSLGRADQPASWKSSAVLPAWREAAMLCVPSGDWDPHAPPAYMEQRQAFAVNAVQAVLDAATPGGGTYANEVNYAQPAWRETFYGTNYDTLLTVKHKYDPRGVLYVHKGVGSDAWVEVADQRLCRAAPPSPPLGSGAPPPAPETRPRAASPPAYEEL